MIELRVLGTLDLRSTNGRNFDLLLTGSKRVALLSYLAVATPRGYHRRDKLLALFWPELDHKHARNCLRNMLYQLRNVLGDGSLVDRGSEEVGLARRRLWCDAVAFEEAVDDGRYAEGVELYRGDLLDGFFLPRAGAAFAHWLEAERERLRRCAAEAAFDLADEEEAAGRVAAAVRWARRATMLLPYEEPLFRRMVELLDRVGDRAGAVLAYEEFADRLSQEIELEPAPETQTLIASVRSRHR